MEVKVMGLGGVLDVSFESQSPLLGSGVLGVDQPHRSLENDQR